MSFRLEDLEDRLLIGSTLVEGSTLTEREARDVLAGRTVSGHPIREARELTNYRTATGWLIEQLDASPYLSVDLILGFHARLLDGLSEDAGRFKSHENYTIRSDGKRHDYLHPSQVIPVMQQWVNAFNHEPTLNPFEGGADLYARFQQTHPFSDGNGRLGRLFLAYWLHRRGFAFRFFAADKLAHLRAIEATNHGDLRPLAEFLRERSERDTDETV
jgi:Fic family protein